MCFRKKTKSENQRETSHVVRTFAPAPKKAVLSPAPPFTRAYSIGTCPLLPRRPGEKQTARLRGGEDSTKVGTAVTTPRPAHGAQENTLEEPAGKLWVPRQHTACPPRPMQKGCW